MKILIYFNQDWHDFDISIRTHDLPIVPKTTSYPFGRDQLAEVLVLAERRDKLFRFRHTRPTQTSSNGGRTEVFECSQLRMSLI